jgi:putative endonuclease
MDGSFYTGYTKDLNERTRQHENGKGAKYTKTHRPQRVAYVELFNNRSSAMKRERAIKNLSHQQKQDLILSKDKK